MQRTGIALGVVLALSISAVDSQAQEAFSRGQNIAPAYEGWERNDDGSFTLVFGYMNRNWEEVIDVPVGPGNMFEPGDPDRGQPTHFQPRRNRFVFRIQVPADFGDSELVWTLTSNGQTERAYGTLKPDYFIDNFVIQANNGAGGAAGTRPDLPDNIAPVVTVEGDHSRTARVGQAISLSAVVTDDGLPQANGLRRTNPRFPAADHHRERHRSARVLGCLSRCRAGAIRPAADRGLGGLAGRRGLALVTRLARPHATARRPLGGTGNLRRARHLPAAGPGPRRRAVDHRRGDGDRDAVTG